MSERITETFTKMWHPDDKDYPIVYTTADNKKYQLYENHSELASSIPMDKPCDFIWDWSSTKKRSILNVYKGESTLLPIDATPDMPSPPKPRLGARIDDRTDDIHNQVAFKIAGPVYAAYVRMGRWPKAGATEIATNIGLIAKEIKATMEMKMEEE